MASKNQTKFTVVPGKQELFIHREFDAAREMVFKAFTTPELVAQWLGPKDEIMKHYDINYKTGGWYKYLLVDSAGNEFAFNGVVHEVTHPERIIQTFEYEGLPMKGHVSMEIMEFEELPGERTRVVIQCVFRSVEDRDGKVGAGMEHGVVDSYERMDDLLIKGI